MSKDDKDARQIKQILFQSMEGTYLRYHMRETDNVIPTDILVRKMVLAGVRQSQATNHASHLHRLQHSRHATILQCDIVYTDQET